ncbi:hypothetical protein niasHT_020282 [Heterodera trifolii]|uniref:HSF-type DNA-binding domain-containing protein n=1 Tax=Heterodera trifolii TaxID=157864 RepID=A0ABD2JQN1_9BILA
MSYYYQQQLKRQALAKNDRNPSISPENHQQQQFINGDVSANTPNSYVTMTYKPYLLREDGEQKIPLFLIKLWNIVEDPSHWEVIRWDESGLSFHIMKPYVFCSDILPYYFKHKNMNSLVRQLNMYGFRKNTPIERSGLARAESDQDHLEFFHPFFRRDHPELLANIHRKVPNSARQQGHHPPPTPQQQHQQLQFVANVSDVIGSATAMDVGREETVTIHTKDLTNIFDELRVMRERQKNMEVRMDELTKENEMLWNEMAHIRGTHLKQQQIVNKLIQFLVSFVGPATAAGKQSHRLSKKRLMYVLDDFGAKRLSEYVGDGTGSVPSPASAPVAGGSGGGTTVGAGTGNAPPIYSTTGRFPSATLTPQIQQQPLTHQNSPHTQPSMTELLDQQPTTSNEFQNQNILSTPPIVHQDMAPSLSDGMLLNDTEMADIAGLNAFLDENSARFNSLSNSIGEHWVNGIDDSELRLQDLFQSVEELSTNRGQNPLAVSGANQNNQLSQISTEHRLFSDDDHLDFSFDLENENGSAN